MRHLGQHKRAHKCTGHGHDCGICVPVTRKELKRLQHLRSVDASIAKTGRARERRSTAREDG